jgi:hypothetical protein
MSILEMFCGDDESEVLLRGRSVHGTGMYFLSLTPYDG